MIKLNKSHEINFLTKLPDSNFAEYLTFSPLMRFFKSTLKLFSLCPSVSSEVLEDEPIKSIQILVFTVNKICPLFFS